MKNGKEKKPPFSMPEEPPHPLLSSKTTHSQKLLKNEKKKTFSAHGERSEKSEKRNYVRPETKTTFRLARPFHVPFLPVLNKSPWQKAVSLAPFSRLFFFSVSVSILGAPFP